LTGCQRFLFSFFSRFFFHWREKAKVSSVHQLRVADNRYDAWTVRFPSVKNMPVRQFFWLFELCFVGR
jgi:hypothetical protein